jgi:hypothetical protein
MEASIQTRPFQTRTNPYRRIPGTIFWSPSTLTNKSCWMSFFSAPSTWAHNSPRRTLFRYENWMDLRVLSLVEEIHSSSIEWLYRVSHPKCSTDESIE